MPDGSIYFQPPSDHNRIPVPLGAVPLPVNMGVQKTNQFEDALVNLLNGPIGGLNTLITGRVDVDGTQTVLTEGSDGKMHLQTIRIHGVAKGDVVDRGM